MLSHYLSKCWVDLQALFKALGIYQLIVPSASTAFIYHRVFNLSWSHPASCHQCEQDLVVADSLVSIYTLREDLFEPTNQDPETLAVSSAKHPSILKAQLPRARFAENPIIGPTSEASSRVSRRKSALKSRSPNEIVPPPSNASRADALTVDQSLTRRSSFTSSSLLLPPQPLSPKRHRANSMIATAEAPWSDNHLRAEDAAHPADARLIAESFDPFRFRQRARSMTDLGAPDPLSQTEAYAVNAMDALSDPKPSPLLGYFMEQDAFFREKARRKLGLTSSSAAAETDRDLASTKYDSIDFSEHSRPVSSISSNASAFSSTLLDESIPPTPYVKNEIPFFTEKQNLAPPHSIQVDGESTTYSSLTSASPSFRQEKNSNKWASNSSSGPMVSPLERLSSVSFRRPSISTRQRSGTVLPPKKPEIISEDFSSTSSTSLSAQPILSQLEDKPVRPPARPPRSNLREIPGKQVDSSLPVQLASRTHDKIKLQVPNKGFDSSTRLGPNPMNAVPVEDDKSIYGSARSTPASLPVSEPLSDQLRSDVSLTRKTEKAKTQITTVKLNSEEKPIRPSLPQKSASRNLSRASQTAPIMIPEAPVDKLPSPKKFDSSSSSKIADDESDEFESADEGDEIFWSVAEEFNNPKVSVRKHDDLNDRTSKPLESQPLLQSSSRELAKEKFSQQVTHSSKPSKTSRFTIIGAFPRSESFLETSMSSSLANSRSFEDLTCEEYQQSPKALPVSLPTKVDREPHRPTGSRSQSSTKSQNQRKVSTKVEFHPRSPPISENPLITNVAPSNSPLPSDPVGTDPLQPSLEQHSMSRTCSLEGLAALRHSNSSSPQSQRKKSGSRSSVHFRQLSKILNFCAKEDSFEEQLSDENTVPVPVGLAEHQFKPINSHPSPHGSPPHHGRPHIPSSWKNSMPKASYEELKSLYGSLEMRRQEVIWELCETENSFAVGLRQVIEIFASPLRTPEGAWISGVPKEVAKLLDWLEDIVNLHSQMAFQAKNSRQYQTKALGLVVHISEVFLELAPKLEIYQPYLVRFSEVTALIDEMVADPDSDFGEFLRMQTALPECGQMNLNSFLLKPVQRLMKYPLFFKQLCEVTPPDHPDHEPTVTLLSTTDSMIRVLQEVKEREDEYEKLKALEAKIKGLPAGFTLAMRDRRLLAQGLLRRVQISSRDRQSMHAASWAMNHRVTQANLALSSPSPQSNRLSGLTTSSNSRRMSRHGNWSQNSLASSFSAGTGSNKSISTKNENDPLSFIKFSPNPTFSDGKQFSDWMVIDKSGERAEDFNHYHRARANGSFESELESRPRRKNTTSIRLSKKTKESPVHVFVFSDLILLATRHSEGVRLIRTPMIQRKKKESLSYYCALEDVGISRLIAVSDISGEFEYPHLLKLDVLPFGGEANQVHQAMKPPVSVLLTFPDRLPGSSQLSSFDEIEQERFKWLAAFHQSIISTYSNSKSKQTDDLSNVLDPSHPAFDKIPAHVQESQERHWWSARHRLVCRELELLNDDPSPEPSEMDHSSLNSSSFGSLRAEPSQLLSIADQNHTVYTSQPQNQHARFFQQLKRSGLGLDFGF